MSFKDDYDDNLPSAKNQKITNENSIFKNFQGSKDISAEVNKIEQEKQKYKVEISKSIIKLKKVLEDKTLSENKSPLSHQIDSDVIRELASLADKINDDENEKQGMGTFLICTTLLKFMLIYRDRFNQLDYRLSKLESKVDDFPNQIEKRLDRFATNRLDNK